VKTIKSDYNQNNFINNSDCQNKIEKLELIIEQQVKEIAYVKEILELMKKSC